VLQYIRLGTVGPKDWGDKPVAIVGGGPSLKGFDFERLKDRFTIVAVNASMFDIPFADAGFTIDNRAMREWWPRLLGISYPQFYAVPHHILRLAGGPPTRQMNFIRRQQGAELTTMPSRITAGGTSGFGALHLAFLRGAKKIVLFGFDYSSGNGQWHHNEGHYTFQQQQDAAQWQRWAKNFDRAAVILKGHNVEVINASPESAIQAFPKCSIEEAVSA
jgi:hypothetical protein